MCMNQNGGSLYVEDRTRSVPQGKMLVVKKPAGTEVLISDVTQEELDGGDLVDYEAEKISIILVGVPQGKILTVPRLENRQIEIFGPGTKPSLEEIMAGKVTDADPEKIQEIMDLFRRK